MHRISGVTAYTDIMHKNFWVVGVNVIFIAKTLFMQHTYTHNSIRKALIKSEDCFHCSTGDEEKKWN